MKILVDVLPETGRKALYVAYALAGLILGAWQVVEQPDWLLSALGVYAFVGTALGLVAEANTGADPFRDVPESDADADGFPED